MSYVNRESYNLIRSMATNESANDSRCVSSCDEFVQCGLPYLLPGNPAVC